MTIKEKILLFLKEMGIQKEDFYRITGISPSNFKGVALKSELGGDKIVKILSVYNILSPSWLLMDEGTMLKNGLVPLKDKSKNLHGTTILSSPDTGFQSLETKATETSKDSILYNMYKDLQVEKEKFRLEKESEIKELNARIFKISEEIGRLKAKLGEEETEEHPKGLGSGTAKSASIKKHSSQSTPDAPSVIVPSQE